MKILLVDYGSFYFKDIIVSLDKMNVEYIIMKHNESLLNIDLNEVNGIILSGGPGRVNNPKDPQLDPNFLKLKLPILGICYGMQVLMKYLGGLVEELPERDLGLSEMHIDKESPLNKGLKQNCNVYMAHYDHITEVPTSFDIIAKTDVSIAMIENRKDNIYAVQYHPEAKQSSNDMQLFKNFIFDICMYSY